MCQREQRTRRPPCGTDFSRCKSREILTIRRQTAWHTEVLALASRLNLDARVRSIARILASTTIALFSLTGCAVGSVESGAFGSDGVKSSPSTFAEILAGTPATTVTSACVVRTESVLCAATLIAPNVVITAGHCAAAHSSWTVVCPNSGDTEARRVTETAVAPTYPGGGAQVDARAGSDLALLRLDQPFAQGAAARIELDPVGSRPRAVAVGRHGDTDQLALSRQFAINYLEPTRGYAFGVDRVIIAPSDAGGGLFDPETMTLYAVSSSSVAVTACRPRQPCTLWSALAPSSQWIRSRLENWGVSANPGPGDVGEEPPASANDAGAPAPDPGGDPGADPDAGPMGDIGEEPPAGESDAGASGSMPVTPSDPCAAAADCAACTAIAICGFCNGRCTLGLPIGPLDASVCAGQPWQWSASDCR